MTESSPEGESPRRRRSLEAQADFMLARLSERVESIRVKKRRLLNPTEEMRRHREATVVLGASIIALLGASVAVAARRVSTRKTRARRARWDAWLLLLKHPEHVVAKPPHFLRTLLERAASAAVASTLAHLIGRYVDKALTDRPDRPPRALPLANGRIPSSNGKV
jgi:hypothetical protein